MDFLKQPSTQITSVMREAPSQPVTTTVTETGREVRPDPIWDLRCCSHDQPTHLSCKHVCIGADKKWVRNGGSLKKTSGFGRLFEWQAHPDPAGREGSAVGSREPLGLLQHQWGVEVHQASSPRLSKTNRNFCGPYAYSHGTEMPPYPSSFLGDKEPVACTTP